MPLAFPLMWTLKLESAHCLEEHSKGIKGLRESQRGSGNKIEETSESRNGEGGEGRDEAGGRLGNREGVGRKVDDGVEDVFETTTVYSNFTFVF